MTILQAKYERRSDLAQALQPDPPPGILRVRGRAEINLGCEVIVDVSFAESRLHVLLSGYVSRIGTEEAAPDGTREIAVAFFEREASKLRYLQELAASQRVVEEQRSSRRLPVKLTSRWRARRDGSWQHATVEDISQGGAFAQTNDPPPVGSKVTVEVQVPGLESAVPIAGRVVRVQHSPTRCGMGLQFIWRDRGGLVRLREMLRRIEKPLSEEPLSGIGTPESDFDEESRTLVEPVEPRD